MDAGDVHFKVKGEGHFNSTNQILVTHAHIIRCFPFLKYVKFRYKFKFRTSNKRNARYKALKLTVRNITPSEIPTVSPSGVTKYYEKVAQCYNKMSLQYKMYLYDKAISHHSIVKWPNRI